QGVRGQAVEMEAALGEDGPAPLALGEGQELGQEPRRPRPLPRHPRQLFVQSPLQAVEDPRVLDDGGGIQKSVVHRSLRVVDDATWHLRYGQSARSGGKEDRENDGGNTSRVDICE